MDGLSNILTTEIESVFACKIHWERDEIPSKLTCVQKHDTKLMKQEEQISSHKTSKTGIRSKTFLKQSCYTHTHTQSINLSLSVQSNARRRRNIGSRIWCQIRGQFHFTNDLKTHTRAQILVLVAVYVPTESKKLQPPKSKAIFPIQQQATIMYNHTPRNQKNENE